MSKRMFVIMLAVSAILAVNSVLSNLANRSSESVFESSAQPVATSSRYDNIRKKDLATIQKALETYRIDNNEFPIFLSRLESGYLVEVPTDPVTKESYSYTFITSESYKLTARMGDGSLYDVSFP